MLLQASHEVQGRLNAFIKNKFIKTEENSKKYLINLINVLEEEMFELARDEMSASEKQLSADYSLHLQTCLQLDFSSLDQHQQSLLSIEQLFYLRHYRAAWELLTETTQEDPSFGKYLASLVPTAVNQSGAQDHLAVRCHHPHGTPAIRPRSGSRAD